MLMLSGAYPVEGVPYISPRFVSPVAPVKGVSGDVSSRKDSQDLSYARVQKSMVHVGGGVSLSSSSFASLWSSSKGSDKANSSLKKEAVTRLQAEDKKVKAHEMAHMEAGGSYTGGAHYRYKVGPDGRSYAVSGDVPINISPVKGAPRATIQKMEVVMAAALAPASPSGQDHSVAAEAMDVISQMDAKISQEAGGMYHSSNDGHSSRTGHLLGKENESDSDLNMGSSFDSSFDINPSFNVSASPSQSGFADVSTLGSSRHSNFISSRGRGLAQGRSSLDVEHKEALGNSQIDPLEYDGRTKKGLASYHYASSL